MKQIISIDLAGENSRDYSVVNSICGNCKTVIDIRTYDLVENEIHNTIFKRCPECGVKFTKHTILE